MSSPAQIPVMEMFYSIQGEGFHTGTPAFFIRLGGCDVGCPWCDVKESWEAGDHPLTSIDDIVSAARDSGSGFAVITGGEPMMYDLTDLTAALRKEGIHIALETSGAYPITGKWDWICFSPKKFKPALDEVYARASELKVVVFNKHDLTWAEGHADRVNKSCVLFLQPEWDRRDPNTPMILNYIREYPKWRISLQTHKYIGVP